jgi:hypothetical protein
MPEKKIQKNADHCQRYITAVVTNAKDLRIHFIWSAAILLAPGSFNRYRRVTKATLQRPIKIRMQTKVTFHDDKSSRTS